MPTISSSPPCNRSAIRAKWTFTQGDSLGRRCVHRTVESGARRRRARQLSDVPHGAVRSPWSAPARSGDRRHTIQRLCFRTRREAARVRGPGLDTTDRPVQARLLHPGGQAVPGRPPGRRPDIAVQGRRNRLDRRRPGQMGRADAQRPSPGRGLCLPPARRPSGAALHHRVRRRLCARNLCRLLRFRPGLFPLPRPQGLPHPPGGPARRQDRSTAQGHLDRAAVAGPHPRVGPRHAPDRRTPGRGVETTGEEAPARRRRSFPDALHLHHVRRGRGPAAQGGVSPPC